MIEHADAALEAWLSTLDPPVDVSFERLTDESTAGSRGTKRPVVSLVLTNVREQIDKRDNQVTDLRSDEGRVVGRQAATRFFELDYLCTAGGPARDAHRALGDVLQLLVDHESCRRARARNLLALGYPIEATLVGSSSSLAALTLRVVLRCSRLERERARPPRHSISTWRLHRSHAGRDDHVAATRWRRRSGPSPSAVDDGAPPRADQPPAVRSGCREAAARPKQPRKGS
jgi:hypothetical protein